MHLSVHPEMIVGASHVTDDSPLGMLTVRLTIYSMHTNISRAPSKLMST